MNGILLIDKPIGWTSFDVVNKIRTIIEAAEIVNGRKKRYPVGHSGTLDPLATGLLIILIGSATKQSAVIGKFDKTYQATMKLGFTSTTGDEEGDKTLQSSFQPPVEQINYVLKRFLGPIEQLPPTYSAIKIKGQPAYRLARKGLPVQLKPRLVQINSLQLESYHYPLVKLSASVSSGTYIRSLVEDIGKALSTGAYTVELRRISIGQHQVSQAASPQDLTFSDISRRLIGL
ncbi:MAG: tRNA pseudouridine(55) synthase TruB [Candidatus Saccharimonadales bacterium]